MNYPLDVEQVLELVDNGFTVEHAAAAAAESHNQGDDYAARLIDGYYEEVTSPNG